MTTTTWQDHVGERVIFTYHHGEQVEGYITSTNDRFVFVHFGKANPEACEPERLTLAPILCKHCKEPVVDEGDEVYTHLDGDPWCDADEWARAGEEAEGADAAEYYDGTYAEVDLPCPHDSDGQHFVGCGCDA